MLFHTAVYYVCSWDSIATVLKWQFCRTVKTTGLTFDLKIYSTQNLAVKMRSCRVRNRTSSSVQRSCSGQEFGSTSIDWMSMGIGVVESQSTGCPWEYAYGWLRVIQSTEVDPNSCPEQLLCTEEEVLFLLTSLDVTKASGADSISARMLKATAPAIAPCSSDQAV